MENSRVIISLVAAFVVSLSAFAQTGIQGVVLSKDKQPLMGAVVSIPEQGIQVSTDSEGVFRIENAQAGKTKISVTSIGCVEYTKKVTIIADSIVNVGSLKMKNATKGGRFYGRFTWTYNYTNTSIKQDGELYATEILGYDIKGTLGYYLSKEKTWSLELGVGYRCFPFSNVDYKEFHGCRDLATIVIPLHVGYRINLSKHFSLRPYAGFYGRYDLERKNNVSEKWNFKNDFAIGISIGIAMKLKKFYMSLVYDDDVCKKSYINSYNKIPSISIGVEF